MLPLLGDPLTFFVAIRIQVASDFSQLATMTLGSWAAGALFRHMILLRLQISSLMKFFRSPLVAITRLLSLLLTKSMGLESCRRDSSAQTGLSVSLSSQPSRSE